MKILTTLVGAVLLAAGLHGAPAHTERADTIRLVSVDPDDDSTDPNYEIDGGGQPGLEHLPRVCGTVPISCGLSRDPGSGAWLRSAPEPEH